MKRTVLALLMSAAALPAFGADLPAKPAYAPVAAPAFSWTGFYAGINAGYGFGRTTDAFGQAADLNGFIGGGQAGANWQNGAVVVGIEGDFQGTTQSQTTNFTVLGFGVSVKQALPWFGTLRGRFGIANGPWMIYATGGLAYAKYKVDVTALGATVTGDTSKAVATFGGGAEWKFAQKWSGRLEYLYFDSGDTTVTVGGVAATGRVKNNIIRGALNYHF